MAKNGISGDNRRHGAVKQRSQTFNPKENNGLKEILPQADLWMLNKMVLRLKE